MGNQIKAIESCTVALDSKRNYATQGVADATTNTTKNATDDLISLSARVLERNQRNSERNSSATKPLRSNVTYATNNLTIATQDESRLHHSATTELYGISVEDLQKEAQKDWDDLKNAPSALIAFAEILSEQKLMRSGQVPPRYTATIYCISCNKTVQVAPALANKGKVLGCPWCHYKH